LGYFWLVHGHFREARTRLGEVLARRTSDLVARTDVLIYACEAARVQGDYDEAIRWGEEGLALARQLRRPREAVRSLRLLAGISVGLGDFERALDRSWKRRRGWRKSRATRGLLACCFRVSPISR